MRRVLTWQNEEGEDEVTRPVDLAKRLPQVVGEEVREEAMAVVGGEGVVEDGEKSL